MADELGYRSSQWMGTILIRRLQMGGGCGALWRELGTADDGEHWRNQLQFLWQHFAMDVTNSIAGVLVVQRLRVGIVDQSGGCIESGRR